MRLNTTLCLGVATLICASLVFASLPLTAQNLPAGAEPALPQAASGAKPAPAAVPPAAASKPVEAAAVQPAEAGTPVATAKPDIQAPSDGTPATGKPGDQLAKAEPVQKLDLSPGDKDSIVAAVNDQPISEFELLQRMALFLAIQMPADYKPTAADIKRIRADTLKNLEEEKIELQEAIDQKITVSPLEVDKRITAVLGEQHHTKAQLASQLEESGSSLEALQSQITAQLAWQHAIEAKFADDINITPAMVDAEMKRQAQGANRPHYLVSEIFLPVEGPQQDASVKATVDNIVNQIKEGASFRSLARTYSRNPSAAQGGDMGWLYDGQLAPELNGPLSKLAIGEISVPIRGPGGWYLLALQQRQEPLGTNVNLVEQPKPTGPAGTLPLARLLLPVAGMSKDVVANAMKVAQQIAQGAESCEQLKAISQDNQMKGTLFMMLGDQKLADLSPDIQKALAQTKSGEIAQPIQSEAGVEIIARCDKRAAAAKIAFKMPSEDEVRQQLFGDQISALANRYRRDLKRDANIQEADENGVIKDALLH